MHVMIIIFQILNIRPLNALSTICVCLAQCSGSHFTARIAKGKNGGDQRLSYCRTMNPVAKSVINNLLLVLSFRRCSILLSSWYDMLVVKCLLPTTMKTENNILPYIYCRVFKRRVVCLHCSSLSPYLVAE
jgi:hypothetical protein